jgi:hypothetical protein
MPLPRSSIISASSSADHLLCFLAGDSDACGGMLRLPVMDRLVLGLGPSRGGAVYKGGPAGAVEVVVATAGVGGTDAGRVGWGEDTEDSFESGALRREAISTVTVGRPHSLDQASFHGRRSRYSSCLEFLEYVTGRV